VRKRGRGARNAAFKASLCLLLLPFDCTREVRKVGKTWDRQSARAGQKAGAISIRGLRIAETEGNREQASINK